MEVAVVEKFPTPWTLKIDEGVVVPIPTNPLGSTMNKGLEVPTSPMMKTGVLVACSSMENVPQGLVVPMPTLPMLVVEVSIVNSGTAVVDVAMDHALYVLLGIVEVDEDA